MTADRLLFFESTFEFVSATLIGVVFRTPPDAEVQREVTIHTRDWRRMGSPERITVKCTPLDENGRPFDE